VICYVERKYFRGMHVELKLDFRPGWWRFQPLVTHRDFEEAWEPHEHAC
jgi:hypothetical protein